MFAIRSRWAASGKFSFAPLPSFVKVFQPVSVFDAASPFIRQTLDHLFRKIFVQHDSSPVCCVIFDVEDIVSNIKTRVKRKFVSVCKILVCCAGLEPAT